MKERSKRRTWNLFAQMALGGRAFSKDRYAAYLIEPRRALST